MRLDVWLVSFHADSTPAKTMASIFDINLRDAMMLEWSVPAIVGHNMSEQDAASAVRTLRGIGAKAEARPTDPSAPPAFELPFAPNEARESSSPPKAAPPTAVQPARRPIAPKSAPARRAVKLIKRVVSEIPADLDLPAMGDDDLPSPLGRRPSPSAPSSSRRPAAIPHPTPVISAASRPAIAHPTPVPFASSGPAPSAVPHLAPSAPSRSSASTTGRSTVASDRARQRPPRRPPRDLPSGDHYEEGPPLELLHVDRPTRPAVRRSVHTHPPKKGGIGIKPLLPAIGALSVGVAAAFIALRRGQTAMLGTADMVGYVLDGVALACLGLALVFASAAVFSKREHFNMAPGVMALVVAVGAAFLINQWRVPSVGPDAELGGAASGLITQSQVSLAGIDATSARALVEALNAAGAISVRGAAPVRFMGAQAFHALAIELPPGPSSRERIIVAFRSAMARFGGSVTADPTPNQGVWVVAL